MNVTLDEEDDDEMDLDESNAMDGVSGVSEYEEVITHVYMCIYIYVYLYFCICI
jgi:hypothetical protein